jgi:hypothetical protein
MTTILRYKILSESAHHLCSYEITQHKNTLFCCCFKNDSTEGKSVLGIKYAFHFFSAISVQNIFHSSTDSATYTQDAITYVHPHVCVYYCCPISIKIGICQQILVKLPKIKFHENLSAVLEFLHMDRQTNIHTEANRQIVLIFIVNILKTSDHLL